MSNGNDYIDLEWDIFDGDERQDSKGSSINESEHSDNFYKPERKDIKNSKQSNSSIYNSRLNSIDEYYEYYLDRESEILELSPDRFMGLMKQVKMPLYGGRWDNYEKDRLRILLSLFALRYADEHYMEDEYWDNQEPYNEILDSIDNLIKDMKEITDEGLYIYFIANMYSATRYNADPMDKLNEFWSEIQGIYLNDNITEFKKDYWEQKAERVYNYMRDVISPSSNNNSSSNISNGSYSNNSDIFKRVKKIIMDKLSVGASEIHLNAEFKRDLGADSLDSVELIMEFEKEFNLTIPDEVAANINTIGQAIDYIRSHIR